MTVLHRGFDTIALSVKAHITDTLLEALKADKARAEEERRDVQFDYGGFTFLLKPHGGAGYSFLLSGGNSGANWSIKTPNAKDPWGIRVSVGSFFLATEGLGAVREHLDAVLASWGIRYREEDVSIARADVCVDILAQGFRLNPDHFVMHSSCRRRDHLTADDIAVNGRSSRVTSVTVGGPANRQIIVYDKTTEIMARAKPYWWDIWYDTLRRNADADPATVDLLRYGTLRRNIGPNRVWRVEVRAGKNLLKDRWHIRTWSDFYARFGDVISEAFEVVRYCAPSDRDTNRARWPAHPIWALARTEMNSDLEEMSEGTDPEPLKEVVREDHIALIYRNVLGSCITLAALEGQPLTALSDFITGLAEKMQYSTKADPARTARQLNEASERYVFVKAQNSPMRYDT
ncbi:hypothetical protein [uncultured Roseobacter sp.]|uniref:hypothetical protein n=1 Tax=uncultured Roseobacter sp. TaxID=114847 RepID=UPI002615D058|nr:hypothetical protein [uncultured Roseobacter sp.]